MKNSIFKTKIAMIVMVVLMTIGAMLGFVNILVHFAHYCTVPFGTYQAVNRTADVVLAISAILFLAGGAGFWIFSSRLDALRKRLKRVKARR